MKIKRPVATKARALMTLLVLGYAGPKDRDDSDSATSLSSAVIRPIR